MTATPPDDLDELLQPTVAPAPRSGPLPWRVQSQFWVAFFGGIPAVTAIAFLNARRLGSSARAQQLIVVSGVVAATVFAVLFRYIDHRTMRIVGRVLAVLLFLLLARIQRDDDMRHRVFGSAEYASLWIAGIVATLISSAVIIGIIILSASVL